MFLPAPKKQVILYFSNKTEVTRDTCVGRDDVLTRTMYHFTTAERLLQYAAYTGQFCAVLKIAPLHEIFRTRKKTLDKVCVYIRAMDKRGDPSTSRD